MPNNERIDVVYVYKQSGNGDELKHSLRSLRNLADFNGKVFVVGDSHTWFSGEITHIPCPSKTRNFYLDAEEKWLKALSDERISNNFIAMNDDMYITERTSLPVMHQGYIKDNLSRISTHTRALMHTGEYLKEQGIEEPLSYAGHVPMLMNKTKRLEVSSIVKPTLNTGKPLLARTVYGNLFNIGGEYYEDRKSRSSYLMEGTFISTQYFIPSLSKMFPKKSMYEKGDTVGMVDKIFPKGSKIIHQLWIGPLPPPTKWMRTWQEKNPDWEYIYWDNEKVFSRKWENQHLIDEYLRRCKEVERTGEFSSARGGKFRGEKATLFAWHVIADLLRYEILYEYGGYMPGADTICLKSINSKFDRDFGSYTVRTGNLYVNNYEKITQAIVDRKPTKDEQLKLDRYAYENASPILACKPRNKFVGTLIAELHKLKPRQLGEAVDTTGNVFMGKMIRKHKPTDLYMIDYVKKANRVVDNDYSIHYSGTMKNRYKEGR